MFSMESKSRKVTKRSHMLSGFLNFLHTYTDALSAFQSFQFCFGGDFVELVAFQMQGLVQADDLLEKFLLPGGPRS